MILSTSYGFPQVSGIVTILIYIAFIARPNISNLQLARVIKSFWLNVRAMFYRTLIESVCTWDKLVYSQTQNQVNNELVMIRNS